MVCVEKQRKNSKKKQVLGKSIENRLEVAALSLLDPGRWLPVVSFGLDGKLFHGGIKRSLVAREVSSDGVVEKKKLLLHHLHSVLVQEFQLDLNIRAELFKLCLLVVEAGQGL